MNAGALATALCLVLTACATDPIPQPAPRLPVEPGAFRVTIVCLARGCSLDPVRSQIAEGTTLAVTNATDVEHTFTDAAGRFDFRIRPRGTIRFRPRAGSYVIIDRTDPRLRGEVQVVGPPRR